MRAQIGTLYGMLPAMSAFLPLERDGQPVYAGFWRRGLAHIIDALMLVPTAMLIEDLPTSLGGTMLAMAMVTCGLTLYIVAFHAWLGATPGKLITGVRITQRDGARIGWRCALRRSAVELGVLLPLVAADCMALMAVDLQAFLSAPDFMTKTYLLAQHYPAWHGSLMLGLHIWMAAEMVFLLSNRRRRSLHDLIADTVVVHARFAQNR